MVYIEESREDQTWLSHCTHATHAPRRNGSIPDLRHPFIDMLSYYTTHNWRSVLYADSAGHIDGGTDTDAVYARFLVVIISEEVTY